MDIQSPPHGIINRKEGKMPHTKKVKKSPHTKVVKKRTVKPEVKMICGNCKHFGSYSDAEHRHGYTACYANPPLYAMTNKGDVVGRRPPTQSTHKGCLSFGPTLPA